MIFLKTIEKVNVSKQSGDDGVSLHNNPIELHSLQQKAHSEFSLSHHKRRSHEFRRWILH